MKRPEELQRFLDEYHDAKVMVTVASEYSIKEYLSHKLHEANIPFGGIDLEPCSTTEDGKNIYTFGAKISITVGSKIVTKFDVMPENWVQSVLDCLGYTMDNCAVWTRKREFSDGIEYQATTVGILVL